MKKEDVDKMSLQEAMDYSVLKIVEQGGRCLDENGGCSYGEGSMHCAIGWLLDEDNLALMESGATPSGLVKTFPTEVPRLIADNIIPFEELQSFHDCALQYSRKGYMEDLESLGIDTSAPQWAAWVEMGSRNI